MNPEHEFRSLGHLLDGDGWKALEALIDNRRESAVILAVRKGLEPEARTEAAAEVRMLDMVRELPRKRREELAPGIGEAAT